MWRIRKIGSESGYIVRNEELANQLYKQFNVKGDWEIVEITEYELGDPMEQ
jgi:flagellar biosynthesis protein FlhB